MLEDDTGHRDRVSTDELVDLIDAASDRLKLITLSACESAALTAQEQLRLLELDVTTAEPTDGQGQGQGAQAGQDPGPSNASAGPGEQVTERLSVVATSLADRLDAAVLARRRWPRHGWRHRRKDFGPQTR